MIQSRFNIPNSTTSESKNTTFTLHYVKATHDYLPSSIDNIDESVTCLYFKKGSIIEVFNKDESGWWDGQCGSKRGWFPSNYVSSNELTRQSADLKINFASQDWNQKMMRPCFNFPNASHDDESIVKIDDMKKRPRENSITTDISFSMEIATKQVTDFVNACTSIQHPIQADIHIYTSRIVTSIKSLLVECNMINKDSQLFKLYPELRKQRKIILIALNRLIAKSKELQSYPENLERDQKQISIFAGNLMDAINHLTKILAAIPRRPLSNLTDSTVDSQRSSTSSLFDTPRSSISSVGYSTVTSNSCSNSSLRQYLNETRHQSDHHDRTSNSSSSSYLTKPNYPNDKRELLHIIMNHQTSISDLIENLKSCLKQYFNNQQQYAATILDITRRVMESVMSFLAIVEHISSNLLDDSRRAFTIPKDPSHVTLIITKESVYSTITNLVTAIRILTETQRKTRITTHLNEDHLYSCCEGVLKTTNECTMSIRACLLEEEHQHLRLLQELSEKNHSHNLNNKQHINKQHHFDNSPDLKQQHPKHMNAYKRLSIASSKESLQSTPSFSSISTTSATNSIISTSSTRTNTNLPLLPLIKPPNVNSSQEKPTPQPLKSRLSRGLSVSSLRSSFSRSKLERQLDRSETSRLPSWMSMHASVVKPEKNSCAHLDISAPFFSNDHLEKEPDFLKLKEQDMVLNTEGEVIGATTEALVQRLTLHKKSSDPEFLRAFFYTFRLFSSPDEFLTLLINRYHLEPPSNISEVETLLWTNRVLIPVRFRIYHVMKTWLESYFDHDQDLGIENRLFEFISNDMNKVMPGPAKRMIELITKTFHTTGGISYVNSLKRSISTSLHNPNSSISKGGAHLFLAKFDDENTTYPQPILGKGLRNAFKKNSNLTSIHVNRIHSVELARQLTLMESQMFCQIQSNEMITQESNKTDHVKAMIKKSTQMTGWIADTILREKDVKKRSNILKHWIKVGDACLQFNNYNTLMAIRSALDSASIIRLKKTWGCLSLKHKSMWETIHKVTDSQRNFAEYRRQLRDSVAPCLPFLGIYLTDMTFIDGGNPDCRTSPKGNQLINFNKYVKMAKILNEIHSFQVPYKFIEVEEIQRYLSTTLQKVEQDDQLSYARSLKCEPKEEEF